jgi:hypothetical protein
MFDARVRFASLSGMQTQGHMQLHSTNHVLQATKPHATSRVEPLSRPLTLCILQQICSNGHQIPMFPGAVALAKTKALQQQINRGMLAMRFRQSQAWSDIVKEEDISAAEYQKIVAIWHEPEGTCAVQKHTTSITIVSPLSAASCQNLGSISLASSNCA